MTAIVSTIFGKGNNSNYGCVIVADKMLSFRDIAVETDSSKLYKLIENEKLKVVIGAAGTAELIEDFVQKLKENVNTIDSDKSQSGLTYVRDVARLSVLTINEMVRENVEAFLIPYDKKLSDVFTQDVPEDFLAHVGNTIEKKRESLYGDIEVIISGVDIHGPHIFKVEEGDYVPTDGIGYDAAGSGFESANWTLLHRSYTARSDLPSALFMTTYAKIVSEESFGVGSRTDGYIITKSSIRDFKDEEIEYLRQKIDEMTSEEEDIREQYLDEFRKRYNEKGE